MFPGHDQPCETRQNPSRRDAGPGQPGVSSTMACPRSRRILPGKNPTLGSMGRQQPIQPGWLDGRSRVIPTGSVTWS